MGNLKKDSIVILSPGFPDGEHDSRCMPYIQMFVKALIANYPELKIHVISFQYPYTEKVFEWNGCQVNSIGGNNKKWNRFFTWRKTKQAFKEIHSSNKIIGILSLWLSECALVGQQLSKQYQIPHIAWALGQDVKKENKYITRLDFTSFKTACISPFSKEQLKLNHGIDSNFILSNGLHTESIPAPVGFKKNYDIISVGSFSDFKRFDWIVECVKEVKKSRPNIKACMIGDGEELENIQNKIALLGLQENIELKGILPHQQCLELMMQSKILLHPSSFEGASTVILEALYYKCYAISITVPNDPMPATFFKVNTLEEMIKKTDEVLSLPENEISYCVNTSDESAKKLMDAFNYLI
ncbi:MAG: glycosyltransferase [Bacteroidota bacterium]|nr:glycosyltransferase [Bacteroidota bacterium]